MSRINFLIAFASAAQNSTFFNIGRIMFGFFFVWRLLLFSFWLFFFFILAFFVARNFSFMMNGRRRILFRFIVIGRRGRRFFVGRRFTLTFFASAFIFFPENIFFNLNFSRNFIYVFFILLFRRFVVWSRRRRGSRRQKFSTFNWKKKKIR